MKKMPLTHLVGVKGTFLLTVVFLALMFALVACGGGSNVPVGTPLYPDLVSATNASPPTLDSVKEDDTIWIDQTAVLTGTSPISPTQVFTITTVWRVEVRGRVGDAEGNPPVMYIRKADIPVETTEDPNQPTGNDPLTQWILTFRSRKIPVWFILFLLIEIRVFLRERENLVELDKTFVIKRVANRVQTGRNTQLSPIPYTLFYTISTNSGARAAFFGTGQKPIEDIIADFYEKALRANAKAFSDDEVIGSLPSSMVNLTEEQFPRQWLEGTYGSIVLNSVLGQVDFPEDTENRTKGAIKQQTDALELWYHWFNSKRKEGEPEITRDQVYDKVMWQQNPVGQAIMRFVARLGSDAAMDMAAGLLNLQETMSGGVPSLPEEGNHENNA